MATAREKVDWQSHSSYRLITAVKFYEHWWITVWNSDDEKTRGKWLQQEQFDRRVIYRVPFPSPWAAVTNRRYIHTTSLASFLSPQLWTVGKTGTSRLSPNLVGRYLLLFTGTYNDSDPWLILGQNLSLLHDYGCWRRPTPHMYHSKNTSSKKNFYKS